MSDIGEPAGPQYGLDPLRPELYQVVERPIDSWSPVSEENYGNGSEFGGVGGLISPLPHVPTASERLSMIYAIDPMDDGTRPDSVLAPELDGNFDPR